MKNHNSVYKKDIVIKFSILAYLIIRYTMSKFQNDIFIRFKMVAITLNVFSIYLKFEE